MVFLLQTLEGNGKGSGAGARGRNKIAIRKFFFLAYLARKRKEFSYKFCSKFFFLANLARKREEEFSYKFCCKFFFLGKQMVTSFTSLPWFTGSLHHLEVIV